MQHSIPAPPMSHIRIASLENRAKINLPVAANGIFQRLIKADSLSKPLAARRVQFRILHGRDAS
jgi:hypothetical protein